MHLLLHGTIGRELARLRADELLERAAADRRHASAATRRTRRPRPRRPQD